MTEKTNEIIRRDVEWYETEIDVRGCQFDLAQVKSAFKELEKLTKAECRRIVENELSKQENESLEDFEKRKNEARNNAFKLTISIIGADGQSIYGEAEDLFDSKNLPNPIRTIYFTNANSFKRFTGGMMPPNHFSLWLHFDKPPLFDPHPLVSEPTRNPSKLHIRADDIGYYRAVRSITFERIMAKRLWYRLIHQKFIYDIGLWLFAIPYSLYMSTVLLDAYLPASSAYASFKLPLFIYAVGLLLLGYRMLFGYLKWAFPVNVLTENNDRAMKHRVFFGGISLGLVGALVRSILSLLWK